MSFQDNLFNESLLPRSGLPGFVRPVAEIWFAIRPDGVKGSGSEEDPYNASTRLSVPRVADAIALDPAVPKLAVVSLVNHGLQDYDEVILTGVGAGSASDAGYFNGRFVIRRLNENQFAYRMHHPGPVGSPSGRPTVIKISGYPFDEIMAELSLYFNTGAMVCLGPGTVETRGFLPSGSPNSGGWHPTSKCRIVGSGMGATALKLVAAHARDQAYAVVGTSFDGSSFLDGFHISDLTIDCNTGGQPVGFDLQGQTATYHDYPKVACHAINISCRDVRVTRVRVINSGTQTLGHECFPIIVGRANPDLELNQKSVVNCVVEDSIIEQPSRNNVRETTCVVLSSGERSTDGFPANHVASAIRRCWIDTRYRDLSGNALDNGLIRVLDIQVVDGIVRRRLKVTTEKPHGKRGPSPGLQPDLVVINSAAWKDASTGLPAPNPLESGGIPSPFLVELVSGGTPGQETEFEFLLPVALPANVVFLPPLTTGSQATTIGVTFHHTGGLGGKGSVVEQNWLVGSGSGDYNDTGATPSHVVRRNQFLGVSVALQENFLSPIFSMSAMKSGACLSYEFSAGQHTVRVRTTQPHGVTAGNTVTVRGAWIFRSFRNGGTVPDQSEYNNNYNATNATVLQKLSDYEFTYLMSGNPPIYGYASTIIQNAGGSPILGLGVSSGTFVIGGDLQTVTATVLSGHGLTDKSLISVFGAVLSNGATDNLVNGVFSVTVLGGNPNQFLFITSAKLPVGATIATNPSYGIQVTTPLIYKGGVALYYTRVPHWLVVNQGVNIEQAYEGLIPSPSYIANGFSILSVPTPTSFTFQPLATPTGNSGGLPTFGGQWQTDFLVFEENTIELEPQRYHAGYGFRDPIPFGIEAFLNKKAFYFDEVYFRENILQYASSPFLTGASQFNGCRAILAEGNVIGGGPNRPLSYRSLYTSQLKSRENYSWDGRLQLAQDPDMPSRKPEDLPISPDDVWVT